MSPTTWGTYRQIVEVLRADIAQGDFAPGEFLPSEAALCHTFQVSRSTIRRALAVLEAERLVHPVHGRGRVVCTREEPLQEIHRWRSLSHGIAGELAHRIRSGSLTYGVTLTAPALARHYGVSRATVGKALSELAGVGLVKPVGGTGYVVCSPCPDSTWECP